MKRYTSEAMLGKPVAGYLDPDQARLLDSSVPMSALSKQDVRERVRTAEFVFTYTNTGGFRLASGDIQKLGKIVVMDRWSWPKRCAWVCVAEFEGSEPDGIVAVIEKIRLSAC